jgi:hypothetical protein
MPASWVPDTVQGTTGFQPITSGVGVASPNMPADIGGQLANGANALLETSTFVNGLWIYNVQSNFTLDGTFVQGPLVRDWYPHNLGVPTLIFAGQTPNNFERNRLSTFIRQSHITAVRDATDSGKEAIRLTLPGTAVGTTIYPLVGGGSAQGSYGNGWQNNLPAGGHKGPHGMIDVVGYIDSFEFGADRFVTAYEYTFDFVIVQVISWLGLKDNQVSIPLQNINQMFQSVVVSTTKSKSKGSSAATGVGAAVNKVVSSLVGDLSNLF